MSVAPAEVFSALRFSDTAEIQILPVLFAEVNAVGAIFVVIPSVIVATVTIMISLFPFLVMLFGVNHYRSNQRSSG
jgi:hypothetical protein